MLIVGANGGIARVAIDREQARVNALTDIGTPMPRSQRRGPRCYNAEMQKRKLTKVVFMPHRNGGYSSDRG